MAGSKKYSGKGLLYRFIFLLVIPGFFVWLIPYLLDHDLINERKWGPVIVPLMIALIIGTAINFFYLVYYLAMIFMQLPDEFNSKKNSARTRFRLLVWMLTVFLYSCAAPGTSQNEAEHHPGSSVPGPPDTTDNAHHKQVAERHLNDTLSVESVLLNNHPVEMSFEAFTAIETPDQANRDQWLCGSPFREAGDEPWITTYQCKNREYISDSNRVLVQKVEMEGNEFRIPAIGASFDANTTIDQFGLYFPNAVEYAKLENDTTEQGDLRCRLYVAYLFDDQWIFEFRKGRLHQVKLWWLLC